MMDTLGSTFLRSLASSNTHSNEASSSHTPLIADVALYKAMVVQVINTNKQLAKLTRHDLTQLANVSVGAMCMA